MNPVVVWNPVANRNKSKTHHFIAAGCVLCDNNICCHFNLYSSLMPRAKGKQAHQGEGERVPSVYFINNQDSWKTVQHLCFTNLLESVDFFCVNNHTLCGYDYKALHLQEPFMHLLIPAKHYGT